MENLTDKQQLFVEHYLACWNATKAARLAGYSDATAGVIGSENLKKPNIQAYITERLASAAMGANEVLARLTVHARADIADLSFLLHRHRRRLGHGGGDTAPGAIRRIWRGDEHTAGQPICHRQLL